MGLRIRKKILASGIRLWMWATPSSSRIEYCGVISPLVLPFAPLKSEAYQPLWIKALPMPAEARFQLVAPDPRIPVVGILFRKESCHRGPEGRFAGPLIEVVKLFERRGPQV